MGLGGSGGCEMSGSWVMVGVVSFHKIFGSMGWQWSRDDLKSCAVDPDLRYFKRSTWTPRGPCVFCFS